MQVNEWSIIWRQLSANSEVAVFSNLRHKNNNYVYTKEEIMTRMAALNVSLIPNKIFQQALDMYENAALLKSATTH